MPRRRATVSGRVLGALVAVLILIGAAPAAGHAQVLRTISSEPLPSKISAYSGVLVWSHWDGTAFQLMARTHGQNVVVSVAPRSVPFDVEVGPDANGRAVAVYSRCRHEAAAWMLGVTTARFTPPAGCVLYRYDFSTGRERRIAGIVGGGSFYLPTIWRNEIAYVRVAGSGAPKLYAQPLTAPRHQRITATALPGGPAGSPGPVSLDLLDTNLSIAWDNASRSQFDSAIYLDTLPVRSSARGHGGGVTVPTQTLLDTETSNARAPGLIGFPSLSSTSVYYGRFDGSTIAPSDDAFQRIGLSGGGAASATAPHALRAQARDGGTTYAIYGPYSGSFANCGPVPCPLVGISGTTFRRRR